MANFNDIFNKVMDIGGKVTKIAGLAGKGIDIYKETKAAIDGTSQKKSKYAPKKTRNVWKHYKRGTIVIIQMDLSDENSCIGGVLNFVNDDWVQFETEAGMTTMKTQFVGVTIPILKDK